MGSFVVDNILVPFLQGACKHAGEEFMSQLLAMIWPTPPDPVLVELSEISSQLYAINGSIQALNALVGWDFEIAQTTNNQENINYYYNQLGNNAPSPAVPPTPFDQWPTLYATITGFSPIGQPTNSGMYYWASQLHDLYMGANVSGGTGSGMIATAVYYAIQQCQMNAQNYLPPWQATQWVKSFMLQITVNQFQAIAALNNAYVFGQNNGASQVDLETIQNQMSEISNNVWGNPPNNGVPQSQWAQYQACMPVWLQTLDSLSQVSGPSSGNPPIGWTDDHDFQGPTPTPKRFICVIG